MNRFDGVSPPFDYGGFWIRFVALLTDIVLAGMLFAVVTTVLGISMMDVPGTAPGIAPSQAEAQAIAVVVFHRALVMMLLFGLYFVVATWWLGGTPGKLACGLRVVRSNGEALTFLRGCFREFLRMFVSGQVLAVGYLLAAFTREKKALHDMICDTRVVKNR